MLSTLNRYQRVRKHSEEFLKKLSNNHTVSRSKVFTVLLEENTSFSSKLPFHLPFVHKQEDNNHIFKFIACRKTFDNELIRIAVSYNDKELLKQLIINYCIFEETFLENFSKDL